MKKIVHGQIASEGTVKGKVTVLKTEKDLSKLKEKRILIMADSLPNYLDAKSKALAFVLDKGSINCHLGKIARELNIPCLVDTKIASKSFKDNDEVQIEDNYCEKIS